MPRRVLENFGYALYFDGSDDSLTVPITPSTTNFNLAFWVKTNVNTANGRIIDWQVGGPADGFTIVQSPTGRTFDFVVNNGGSETARIRAFIPTEEWTHYVVTYSPTSAKVYTNATLRATDTTAVMSTAATTLTIGKRATAASNFSKMYMDKFVFDNGTPWTQSQIDMLYANGTIPSGADVIYTFEENVNDSSGNGNNGTLSGGEYRVSVSNGARLPTGVRSGHALNFSHATTDKVTIADAAELRPETTLAFTWSQWVYLFRTNNNNLPRVMEKGGHYTCIMGNQVIDTVGNCFALEVHVDAENAIEYWSSTRLQPHRWYFIATVFDNGTVTHYINGQPDVTNVILNELPYDGELASTEGEDLIIGNSDGNSRNWPGFISDSRYHNRVLTQAEINDLMNAKSVSNGLAGEWLMSEGTGTDVADTSGNDNDGTITGATWEAQSDTKSGVDQGYETVAGTLYEDFESLTGWSQTTGTTALSTAFVKTGTNSFKVTSVSGGNGVATKTISDAVSFVNAQLHGCWVYIEDVSKVSDIQFFISSHASLTNHFQWRVTPNANGLFTGWNFIVIPLRDWAEGGTIAWTDTMIRFRVRVTAVASQVAVVYFDSYYLDMYAKPQVLFTFDDNRSSDYDYVFSYMDDLGLRGTLYVNGSTVDGDSATTLEEVTEMYDAGWAVANHTYNHIELTTLSTQAEMEEEIRLNSEWLKTNGFTRAWDHFAYPNGSYNTTVLAAVAAQNMKTARSVISGAAAYQPISKGLFNPYTLKIMNMKDTTTLQAAKDKIDDAILTGTAMIFMFHRIVDGEPESEIQWPKDDFEALIDYAKTKQDQQQISIVTIDELYERFTNGRYRSVPPVRSSVS